MWSESLHRKDENEWLWILSFAYKIDQFSIDSIDFCFDNKPLKAINHTKHLFIVHTHTISRFIFVCQWFHSNVFSYVHCYDNLSLCIAYNNWKKNAIWYFFFLCRRKESIIKDEQWMYIRFQMRFSETSSLKICDMFNCSIHILTDMICFNTPKTEHMRLNETWMIDSFVLLENPSCWFWFCGPRKNKT